MTELNVCQATTQWTGGTAEPPGIQQSVYTAPARRIIGRERDLHDAVPIVCSGWAASVVMLSDGSRQILSFLLPGDLVSPALFLEPRPHYLVEATLPHFRRSELKAMLLKRPDMLDKWWKA